MQHFDYKPHGVCPMRISFDLEGDTVHNVSFTGGCNGNLSGHQPRCRGHDGRSDRGLFPRYFPATDAVRAARIELRAGRSTGA
ncbi:MAG: TSCPD domain-containing protein [Butyricicoccaceae bacterium]